jgi:hypothetical protein
MNKFYYVKRNDDEFGGSIVEIPERSLEFTLKQHPTWRVMDTSTDNDTAPIVPEAPKSNTLHCPLCGVESKSEHGLKVHKARKHG